MNNNINYATAVKSQHSVVSRLQYLTWGEFSGTLSVTSASGQSWELLFYQGQMVWGSDRAQPNRFWQRHISSQLPHRQNVLQTLSQALDRVQPKVVTRSLGECWQYQGLLALLELAKISKEDLGSIITAAAREILFDLLQANHRETLSFQSQVERFFEPPIVSIGIQKVLDDAQADWQEWRKQRLTIINPSKAPVIRQTVELYRQTTPTIYQNLARVITGNLTFREIATTINQDLLLLTRSLARYIKNGIIELVDLPDIDLPDPSGNNFNLHPSSSPLSSLSSTLKPQGKLVVCIDDSPQICELMKVIVTEAGYRFIGIQDATQALSRLLELKPDIVFLDLMMPQINGYEVCSQIRKISSLTHIPVVILTGKDGLMDRVRAKVTGSTDFITKPIDRQQINNVIERYTGMVNSESKVPN